jgi:pyruvate/2-oxoglutarate dehydrogenase complex dihydrolipoamide dehydrogenase (E3) component
MPQTEPYDVLILGSGQGGTALAWHMASSGKRTCVVERRYVGGSCPNIACLPSKNEIWSARIGHLARQGAHFGAVTGKVTTDMAAVVKRKRNMVRDEIAAIRRYYETTGAELIMASGRFTGPKTLEAALNDGGTRRLSGEQVFINVGTQASLPNVPGLKDARPLTNVEILELDRLPGRLIVLGGGYVGLEMAQAYRRLGAEVTVVEAGPQLMGREDPDVSGEIQRILAEEGVRFLIHVEPLEVSGRSGDAVRMTVRTGAGQQTVEGSDLLVAAGRTPNTAGIGLEAAGVELDGRGFVRVNERLETTAPGVWALGECAGSPQFTHVSIDDFRIVRDNLSGGKRSTRDRLTPYCMFTDPPLARVGLSELEAERQGLAVRVARLPMSSVLRTETTDETQGFMKALVGDNDGILGFTMVGADAGEVMAVVQMAMLGGLPFQRLRDAVIAHPTMAEGLGSLFSTVPATSASWASPP